MLKSISWDFKILYKTRAAHLLPLLLLLVCTAWIRLLSGPWPIDDAYITFRYADNLAAGVGFVYNHGESVLGTSTPFYTLMLAGLAALGPSEIPVLAHGLNLIFDILSAVLLFMLALRIGLTRLLAFLCTAVWLFYPIALRYSLGGMETSAVAAVLLAVVYLFLTGHRNWAAFFIGLSILIRLDSLAAATVFFSALTIERKRIPVRQLLIFLLPLLPWVVFASFQFGSPIPQSVLAKGSEVYRSTPFENTRQVFFQLGNLIVGSPIGTSARGIGLALERELQPIWMAAAVTVVYFLEYGALGLYQKKTEFLVIPATFTVFLLAYCFLGFFGNLSAEWYIVGIMPFVFLAIFSGVKTLSDRWPKVKFLFLGYGFWICIAQVLGLNYGRDSELGFFTPLSIWSQREILYKEVAEFLGPRLDPSDVVAAAEIGALGYYCDCTILDTFGLISPEVLTYYPLPESMYVGSFAISPSLIYDVQPTYIVTLDIFSFYSLQADTWFQENYEVVWERATDALGSRALLVFSRIRNITD